MNKYISLNFKQINNKKLYFNKLTLIYNNINL